jgi:heme oxygenase
LELSFRFHLISEPKILNDLVIARLAFPSSKLEAFEFINDLFGVKHHRTTFYHQLEADSLTKWQDEARARITSVAKKNFGFNFSLVFYDLTTLCFESFETDELRACPKSFLIPYFVLFLSKKR